MRIAICTGQIPFARGGAELQTEALAAQLRLHGHQVEIIQIPFRWYPKSEILKGYLAWRLINLDESEGVPIDRVIALKFPGFVVKHHHKVTWLIQQFRQAYDLLGTEFSHFDNSPEDTELRRAIWQIDTVTLTESRRIFTIAGNPGKRLWEFNRLRSETLYMPPALDGQFKSDGYGDYIFTVSRLNRMKRVDQLVRAMGLVRTPVRCKIAGQGEELENLRKLAQQVGATERIEFLGFVDDSNLLDLYARALAVYYAPIDEDYGLVTVEAMKSYKPVLTTTGSGGPLEFVDDGRTGFVTPAGDAAALARCIDELYEDRNLAERMGTAGSRKVSDITWNNTIRKLLEA
ncbi:MAG: glycosyltransferase family 4 protein [Anaerolineae bacterium]